MLNDVSTSILDILVKMSMNYFIKKLYDVFIMLLDKLHVYIRNG